MNRHQFRNVLLCIYVCLIFGCGKSETIRHGVMKYNVRDVFGSSTPPMELAEAAASGNTNRVNHLIDSGAPVNFAGKDGITPLWWAMWARDFTGFNALLERGANPNAHYLPERYSIMYLAADSEDSRFLAAALKHGGDPNFLNRPDDEVPLTRPLLNGNESNVDLLITAKADLNWQKPIDGTTLPMFALAGRRDYKMAYKLFQYGANPALKDHFNNTIYDFIMLVSKHASNNDDPYRQKTLDLLKAKGIGPKSEIPVQNDTNTMNFHTILR